MPYLRKSTVVGALFLVAGVGIIVGHWLAHHTFDHFPVLAGGCFMIFGSLLVDPETASGALKALTDALKGLWPWRKDGTP